MTHPTYGEIPLPLVHLNGTGRETLTTEYSEARAAIYTARRALAAVTCNARDYYPLGDGAYNLARSARTTALQYLDHVAGYLEAHLEHLFNH
jgi:hypothetical protein